MKVLPTGIRHLLTGCALAALALPELALAENAPPATAGGAGEQHENDIIVTAQRRNETLESVPMSVSVISQQTLSNAGVNSVRDLANVTTGFQVGNGGSYPQPAIRGITTINAGSYENNVAVFVDGLYQTTPQILNVDLPNVQNIQVLKGPQGTLYGRNATGGALLIDTIEPGRDWAGSAEATYGRFNDRRARGYVAGPLSDRIGLSLAGTFRRTDGYIMQASRTTPGQFDGTFLGLKQESIRAKLKFEITDSFRAELGYNYVRASDPRGVQFTPIENVANSYTVPGRNTRPTGLGEAAGDVFTLDFKQHEGFLKLELDTGIGTLRSVTGYADGRLRTTYDAGGTYVPDSYSDSITRDRTFQQSLEYNITAVEHLDLLLGGNYYNIKSDYLPGYGNAAFVGPASIAPFTYPDPATTLVPISSYLKLQEIYFKRTKKAWAVFADATYHATDQLSITVGGRYSKETQDVAALKNNFFTTGPNVGQISSTPYTYASSAKSSSYSKFTPRASIRYEISPRTNVYLSYSQGFRGGEWNSVIPSDNPALWVDAKQETINAYELGLKSAQGRFHYELAGFYYDYKNLQVSATTFVTPPGGGAAIAVVTLQNAPSAKIYGAEANFDFDVTDNFKVHAGATWLHARYGDNFVFIGTGVNPNVSGFNVNSDPLKVLLNVANLPQNLSGLQMARSPDFTGFLGLEYNVPIRQGGIKFGANVRYTTSYVVTNPSVYGGDPTYNAKHAADPTYQPNNTVQLAGSPYVSSASVERAVQSAFALVNASVTWTDPSAHYYVRVWGNNLTDVHYRTHYNPSSSTYSPMGEPLTFGGTIGFKF